MVKEKINQILQDHFDPTQLNVVDDSAKHAGHPESLKSGGGHFTVFIVSDAFFGKSLIERHRLIYDALKPLKSSIHALAIKAQTPEELSS